ncbi:MAG: transporter substrate-binding domain-containing protein [Deltaproteobacteria bacterium]|nr:transporter substrate-binding domain-containing protein [Deltaproteobacteria bacterium]
MKKNTLLCWLLFGLLLFALTGNSLAATADSGKDAKTRLIVGTKESPPFSMKRADGTWEGLSIDLWKAIAEDMDLDYEFKEMTLGDLLNGVYDNKLTAAVAALTVTDEREKKLDFSHPFYFTGLGIAVNQGAGGGWGDVVRDIFSRGFLQVLLSLSLLLLICGLLVWMFERRGNPEQFGGRPIKGIGSGFWWAAVTMTTVGYGDKAPKTLGGRLVGLVWMFAGIIVISSFTAAMTSSLTMSSLSSVVKGPKDLYNVKVATVGSSTSEKYLNQQGISFQKVISTEEGLKALAAGHVDAVVYDAPILQYLIHQKYSDKLALVPGTFDRQTYAIALSEGSSLRETVNRALLAKLHEPWWQETINRYLGP